MRAFNGMGNVLPETPWATFRPQRVTAILRVRRTQVKFVVADEEDWLYAKRVIHEHSLETRAHAILISPVWSAIDLQQLANWIAASGLNVRMQLQLHKYIWGPDVRGV